MLLKEHVLRAIRRGTSVAWCPEWMNLGNLLYLGVWAHERAANKVLLHSRQRPLLERVAPVLVETKFLTRERVPFTARRVMPWREEVRGDWYCPPNLEDYIQTLILPDSELVAPPQDLNDALVINVRRGDYYSNPDVRQEFGMNQIEYIDQAVTGSVEAHGAPARFVIVSDDQQWCREHITSVVNHIAPVEFPDGDAIHDLATITHAKRLVLPNSTFSYWGGYIGDVLAAGREVTAPWFWSRNSNGGRAHQLRPHWNVIGGGAPDRIDD